MDLNHRPSCYEPLFTIFAKNPQTADTQAFPLTSNLLNCSENSISEINEIIEIVSKKMTQKRNSKTVEISHYGLNYDEISQLIYPPKKY